MLLGTLVTVVGGSSTDPTLTSEAARKAPSTQSTWSGLHYIVRDIVHCIVRYIVVHPENMVGPGVGSTM